MQSNAMRLSTCIYEVPFYVQKSCRKSCSHLTYIYHRTSETLTVFPYYHIHLHKINGGDADGNGNGDSNGTSNTNSNRTLNGKTEVEFNTLSNIKLK